MCNKNRSPGGGGAQYKMEVYVWGACSMKQSILHVHIVYMYMYICSMEVEVCGHEESVCSIEMEGCVCMCSMKRWRCV